MTRQQANRRRSRATPLQIYKAFRRAYGPQHWWPAESPWEMIVGAILTQNTAWTNVEKAIETLKENRALALPAFKRLSRGRLQQHIRSAGFFRLKAQRLQQFVVFLERHAGGSLKRLFSEKTPALRRRLLGVRGIGPETADSILLYAAKRRVFVIDAYTRRIFSRLGHIRADADYGTIQRYFEARLPRRTALFNDYHALIVRHAKNFCRVRPQCPPCPLRASCPHPLS